MPPAPQPLIQCAGVCKSFAAQRVLEAVDLDVRAGEVHVLAGENGAGKSTLVKILCGVHQADAGEIRIAGQSVNFRSVHEAADAGVAMIHQELSLAPSLSVMDNLFLGRERAVAMGWVDRRAQRRLAIEALQRVGLAVDPNVIAGSLPLAARQLVEIAKALMRDARIIIMDEPTSALPKPDVERLFGLINQLKSNAASPAAIVYISHRMEEIYRLADRITVLRDGRRVVSAPAGELSRAALVHAMVGRAVDEEFRREACDIGEELLRLEGVSTHGARGLAARDVSFSLRAGEVIGLAGLQGSGAGSLLHAMFGDGRVVNGETLVRGRPVRVHSARQAIALGIALLTDDRKTTGLCQGLSVAANVVLPSINDFSPRLWMRTRRERAAARSAIVSFGIRCRSGAQSVRTLSGGNQQKVALGKWLRRQPSILLLHDPTRGVDVAARQEIHRLIHEATERGAGVIMTGSDLPELLALSDRVIVLHRGMVTAELDRDSATPQRVMAAAMGATAETRAAGAAA